MCYNEALSHRVDLNVTTKTPHFKNDADRRGVADDGASFAAAFADVDNDGDPDLMLTNSGSANRFYINDGKGNFKETAAAAGLEDKGASRAAVFGDVNGVHLV